MANGVKDRLEEIMNKQEYQVYYEDNRNIFQRIKDAIIDWLNELLMKIFPALGSSTSIASIIVTILVIVGVLLLIFILYRVSSNRRLRKQYAQRTPLSDLHEMDWTYEDHLQEADKNAEQAQHEQAIRHLFLGLLLYFHDVDWVEAQIWKTNWEYYAELKKVNKREANTFNKLALTFDQITYGKRAVTKDMYQMYYNEVMAVIDRSNEQMNDEQEE